jgi:UDP-2,3-diacylglucosamine hydrolase
LKLRDLGGGTELPSGIVSEAMQAKPVHVASDVHLTPSSTDRERPFLQWLRWAASNSSRIVLNGDIFDFWYEYGSVVPRGYTRLLGLLAEIVDSGIPVDFMGGNHDWWAGTYFTEELGIRVMKEPTRLQLAGWETLLAHGDGLGTGDLGYRGLKLVFRGRVTQWAFRRLHPDLGAWIARRVSKTDFRSGEPSEGKVGRARFLESWARERLAADESLRLVVLGHTHIPVLKEVHPGRWYANAGDWIHQHTFLRIPEGGPPGIFRWTDGQTISLPAPELQG